MALLCWDPGYPSSSSGEKYWEGLMGGLKTKTFPTWPKVLQQEWLGMLPGRAARDPSPEQLIQPQHLRLLCFHSG